MTYEEAIREIEWIKERGFVADKGIIGTERIVRACDMAIECVEKQIPKKPKNRRIRTLYGDSKYHTQMVEEFTCPCCDERIMFRVTIKRCLVCGQALDWSEEE